MASHKAVLWDVDGTLVETDALHYKALEAVGRVVGYEMTAARMASFAGLTMDEVWGLLDGEFGLSMPYAEWIEAITHRYAVGIEEVRPRSGVLETLRLIDALGVPQAAVSNATRGIVDANLSRLVDVPVLQFGLCRSDVSQGKPDPEPYLEAARRLGLEPKACIAVEDSATGARSAAAAGMFTIHWPPELGEALPCADLTIASLEGMDWDGRLLGRRDPSRPGSVKKS